MNEKTLLDAIIAEHDCAEPEAMDIGINAGYHLDTLREEAIIIGTCWDGNNRPNVWQLASGGYYTSAAAGEVYEEELPYGFEPIEA